MFVVGWSIADDEWINLGNTNVTGDENQGSLTSESFVPDDFEIITFGGLNDDRDTDIDLEILNAISDNRDDLNAYFRIVDIEDFPDNNVQIFNRWGVRVFEKDGYTEPEPKNGDSVNPDEVFTGISNGRATINAGKLSLIHI